MKIIIKATGFELEEAARQKVEEEIASLEKFLPLLKESDIEAFVEVEKTTRHHQTGPFFRAECQINLPGKSLRAEAIRDSLDLALIEAKDEMQRQVKKYKNKRADIVRRSFRKAIEVVKKKLTGK